MKSYIFKKPKLYGNETIFLFPVYPANYYLIIFDMDDGLMRKRKKKYNEFLIGFEIEEMFNL